MNELSDLRIEKGKNQRMYVFFYEDCCNWQTNIYIYLHIYIIYIYIYIYICVYISGRINVLKINRIAGK
jgi:hypothetical protein